MVAPAFLPVSVVKNGGGFHTRRFFIMLLTGARRRLELKAGPYVEKESRPPRPAFLFS
jgi:hypothetical protein